MAQYNHDLGVCFNDNDGGASHFIHGRAKEDFERHYKRLGKWGARFFFIKICWRALTIAEGMWDLDKIKHNKKEMWKV